MAPDVFQNHKDLVEYVELEEAAEPDLPAPPFRGHSLHRVGGSAGGCFYCRKCTQVFDNLGEARDRTCELNSAIARAKPQEWSDKGHVIRLAVTLPRQRRFFFCTTCGRTAAQRTTGFNQSCRHAPASSQLTQISKGRHPSCKDASIDFTIPLDEALAGEAVAV